MGIVTKIVMAATVLYAAINLSVLNFLNWQPSADAVANAAFLALGLAALKILGGSRT